MKIGIADGKIWGNDHYLMLKSFGFDYYDFGMLNTDAPLYSLNDEEFDKYLTDQKALAEKAEVKIWQVHGPWRYPPKDVTVEDRAERLEKMKRSIKGAAVLGAKYWVVHPIMPYGVKDITTGETEKTHALNLEFMKELLETARKENVIICLENMPFTEFSLSSPTEIADFIYEINDPSFQMCLDTGHANVREDWLTPADSIRKYSDIIKILHVHDNMGRNDQHLAPFHGTIDWKDFGKALNETKFDGVISLETAPNRNLPNDILKEMYVLYAKIAKAICK